MPLPAMVLTSAVARLMTRMRRPVHSETKSVEDVASRTMPRGSLKVAAVPTPSILPGLPEPASVATEVEDVLTLRTR